MEPEKRRGRPARQQDSIAELVTENLSSQNSEPLISDMSVPNVVPTGSPVEEKIRELVDNQCPDGWQPIETAPKDGNRIVVSETGHDQLTVYWRIRRVVNRKKLRYEKEGGWTDILSRLDINYEPKYWRPYSCVDYTPWPRKA